MAIFDNDGTALCEAGKMYDSDGTADYQIGKIYDNDGTADSLIYTADYVFFPSAYVSNKANWTDHGEGSGSVVINGEIISLSGHSKGSSWSLYNYFVDFSKYETLCIEITQLTGHPDNKFYIRWRDKDSNGLKVDYKVNELDDSLKIGIHRIDISSVTSQCYLGFSFSNGGGGTITKIWFE